MAWLPLAALVLATVTSGTPVVETSAERLHRKGVHCMDVIERPECAIENFEALLDERTRQRELLTDGMLRLLQLYRRTDREEDVGPLLRRFWDAGGDRRSRGHVPYSARFVPGEFDMMINIDPPRLVGSELMERGGDTLRDMVFTCDPIRRHDIQTQMRWQRAATQAANEGRETWEVFYEQLDAERERKRKYEERRERETKGDEEQQASPLVFELACPLAEALSLTDNRDWQRMTGISDHRHPYDSVAIFEVEGLEARLAAAVSDGRLESPYPGRWRLPEFEHGPEPIGLAMLDHDELTVAPVVILDKVEQASHKRKRQMSRELDRLVGKIPRDTGMFMVMTKQALEDLGFSSMERKGLRKVLETVLPRPKGLQVAAVAGSSLAFLTRVPTDTAVRGRMLINLANLLLARNASEDPEMAEMLEGLDVAEASDRKALLASYVISSARLEKMLWE